MLQQRHSALEKPPHSSWKLGPGKVYTCFLSHYKQEAGMEARYLRDLLQKMLRKPCFLDSQNLANLKNLFKNGLERCDVLVLLATKNVLRRPYCLLELWCAQRAGLPIVVVDISGREILWTEASRILADIGAALDDPGAVGVIESTLKQIVARTGKEDEEPPTLSEFGADIAHALRVHERTFPSFHTPEAASATFHPWGTDSDILAAVSELVDMMFLAVGAAAPQLARTHLLSKSQNKALDLATRHDRAREDMLTEELSGTKGSDLSESGPPRLRVGERVKHKTRGSGQVVELTWDGRTRVRYDDGTEHRYKRKSSHKLSTGAQAPAQVLHAGRAGSVRRELMRTTGPPRRPSSRSAHNETALCISCCRVEREVLESALFLQEALPAVLGGNVHFKPEDPERSVVERRWSHGGLWRQSSQAKLRRLNSLADRQPWLTEKRRALLCKQLSDRLLQGVAGAQAVLLLQTSSAFTDALTLLELYWATRQDKPIICLRIQGESYDFAAMSHYLEDLESNLVRESPETAELVDAWLDEHMITFQHMAKSLAEHIPYIITIPVAFSPDASENVIAGSLQDIAMRLNSAAEQRLGEATPSTMEALRDGRRNGRVSSVIGKLVHKHQPPQPTLRGSATLEASQSRGSSVVEQIQAFRKGCGAAHEKLDAQEHGKLAAQRLSILTLAATFLAAVWRGHMARQRTNEKRARRDAALIIKLHARLWRARRQRRASKQNLLAMEGASPENAKRQFVDVMGRTLAHARLRAGRAAREREKRIAALKKLQQDDADHQNEDVIYSMALLVISVHVQRWRNVARANAQVRKLQKAAEEAEAAKKKVLVTPIPVTPELELAKLLLLQRNSQRHLTRSNTVPLPLFTSYEGAPEPPEPVADAPPSPPGPAEKDHSLGFRAVCQPQMQTSAV